MKRKINYLGFLSLLSLLAILGYLTENKGFYGFLGFAAYFRYFSVGPDELFEQNLRKACTMAYLTQLISLVPLMLAAYFLGQASTALVTGFVLAFVLSFFVFTIALVYLEWEESKNARVENKIA